MGLFDKMKKNKKDAAKEVKPAADQSASAGPSIKNVKIASAPAADTKPEQKLLSKLRQRLPQSLPQKHPQNPQQSLPQKRLQRLPLQPK